MGECEQKMRGTTMQSQDTDAGSSRQHIYSIRTKGCSFLQHGKPLLDEGPSISYENHFRFHPPTTLARCQIGTELLDFACSFGLIKLKFC
jgi:hypothetical protein